MPRAKCRIWFVLLVSSTSCVAKGKPANRPEEQSAPFRPAPGSPIQVGRAAGYPAVADLDNDGHADIVVPCAWPGAETGRLCIFLGDGAGRFDRSTVGLQLPAGALKLALGDIDNDGDADAVLSHHDTYELSIFLGDGQGGFEPAPRPTVTASDGSSPHTHSIALADVNGDDNLDILTTCADDNAVAVLLGDERGGFEPSPGSPFAAGNHPYEGITTGDVNQDGNVDVVVPNLHGGAVSILVGDGKGRFTQAPDSPVAVGTRPGFATIGDLNGDSTPDVVATHDGDAIVTVLFGGRGGTLRPAPFSPLRLPQRVWGAVIADIDADGHNDLILGGVTDRVFVLLADGRGGLHAPPTAIRTSDRGPGYITLGDLNGDKKPDLVVGHFSGSVMDVFLAR